MGEPINIEIKGKEIDVLLDEAEKVKAFIEDRNIPGVEALRIDIDCAKPEMPIVIDREKARRLNAIPSCVTERPEDAPLFFRRTIRRGRCVAVSTGRPLRRSNAEKEQADRMDLYGEMV